MSVLRIHALHSARIQKNEIPYLPHTDAVERDFNDRKPGRGTQQKRGGSFKTEECERSAADRSV